MPLAVVAGNNEYRLVELVTTSPLGSVYHARHVSSERVVAVRLLRSRAGDPAALGSFRELLPAIAVLRHRNILPVEAWGDADGVPYVVTPLPDAGVLTDLLAGGWRPDPSAMLQFLRGVAAAIDYAHRLGVVHGGLEPASVLVGADGSALVSHFGLARLAGAPPLPGGHGGRSGSAAHIAPERVLAGTLGPAADVYAFAVIAHELLAGAPPAADGDAASRRAVTDPSLPAPVGDVLRRGLDSDPAGRWASCGALLDALEPALGAPPAPLALARPRRRRVPARVVWLVAAAGLLLMAAIAVAAVVASRAGAPARPVSAQALAPPGDGSASPGGPVEAGPSATPAAPASSPSPAGTATPSPRPSRTPVPAATARPATPTPSATPRPTPTPGLSLAVSDPTPRPGESNVQVTGRGFDPSQQYVVVFVQSASWRVVFGPASPRSGGDFTSPIQIPASARTGAAALVACVYRVNQGPTDRCAQASLTIR